jgi:hypothetical protein
MMHTSTLLIVAILAIPCAAAAQTRPCGGSLTDWCPAPTGDPCVRHRDTQSCQADPQCYGLPYRGESLVACILDPRGFAKNCPTVGCSSTPPGRR